MERKIELIKTALKQYKEACIDDEDISEANFTERTLEWFDVMVDYNDKLREYSVLQSKVISDLKEIVSEQKQIIKDKDLIIEAKAWH